MPDQLDDLLDMVWASALDASNSRDFRAPDGSLDEGAYLRYQRNVLANTKAAIRRLFATAPGPSAAEVVDVLCRHQWNHRQRRCSCGWTQLAALGYAQAQINHPAHVAQILQETFGWDPRVTTAVGDKENEDG